MIYHVSLARAIRSWLSVLVVVATLAGLQLSAADAQSGSISGKAISAESGHGISGAIIGISGMSRTATSDVNGAFQIDHVPLGQRELTARKPDFKPTTVTG